MEDLTQLPSKLHSLTLENREKMQIRGVTDVTGFDDTLVLLRTSLGQLSIRGEGLHVERIDLESGELELRGQIRELQYDDRPTGSLWAKLFA
jgi:sporulation protein YabP